MFMPHSRHIGLMGKMENIPIFTTSKHSRHKTTQDSSMITELVELWLKILCTDSILYPLNLGLIIMNDRH